MRDGVELGIKVSHMLRIFSGLKPRTGITQNRCYSTELFLLVLAFFFLIFTELSNGTSVQAIILIAVEYIDDVV